MQIVDWMSQRVKRSARGLVLPRSSSPENGHLRKKCSSCSTSGHGDSKEWSVVEQWHVHSSLLVVTSNQNASNKKNNHLNIYPKPGMSHYIPCLIAE
jgi:hypothetical protein